MKKNVIITNFTCPIFGLYLVIIICFLICSCAIAPLTSTYSARSLGKGNMSLDATFYPILASNFVYGVGENTDVGIVAEVQLSYLGSIWVKHSFKNNSQKHSLAAMAGIFSGADATNSHGYYFGPVYSYRSSKWEWYTSLKYNQVFWDGQTILNDDDRDYLFSSFETDDEDFGYLQANLGIKYYFGQNFYANAGAIIFSNFDEGSSGVPHLALGWDF